jgi:hypothetical protein
LLVFRLLLPLLPFSALRSRWAQLAAAFALFLLVGGLSDQLPEERVKTKPNVN